MKILTYVLAAVLICAAGFSDPGWAITVTPGATVATTGQPINFQIGSTFQTAPAGYPNPTCTFSVYFGDEMAPFTPQLVTPGSCFAIAGRGIFCSTNIVHTYQDSGLFLYQALEGTCGFAGGATRGQISVTCPAISLGCNFSMCPPTTLPAGNQGKPYSATIAATGGKQPITYTATSALPAGLSLSPSGVLSGTPSISGTFSITVRAADSCSRFDPKNGSYLTPQTSGQTFSLTINPCPPVALTSTSPMPTGMVGTPYSFTFSATGQAPIRFQAPPPQVATNVTFPTTFTPPPGLIWNGNTGTLSGMPTAAGNYTVPVAAVDSCLPAQTSWPIVYPLLIQCQYMSITSPGILADATLGQPYSYQITGSGGQQPYTFTTSGGALPPGMGMSSGGLISGTPTLAGKYNIGVNYSDSCSLGVQTINKTLTLTVNCTPLSITTPYTLPAGTVNTAYSAQILAAGGQAPVTFTLMSGTLPPGLTISASGQIAGTPTTEGTYRFTINAQDSCAAGPQNVQKVFVMVVSAVPPPPCPALSSISPTTLGAVVAGQSFAAQLQVSGGTSPVVFSISAGSLPAGVTLTQTGLMTGMPSIPGTYSFTVNASDSCPSGARTAQQNYSMQVQAPPSVCPKLNLISVSPLPAGKVNQAYSYQLLTTGGQPPVLFSVVAGSLPPGLNLAPSGLISGIPATAGNYSLTIRTEDSCPGGSQVFQTAFTAQIDALPTPGKFVVAASPASLAVPRGTNSVGQITYTLTGDPSLSGTMTSQVGNFIVGGELIGTNPTPVTVNMIRGSAVITEQVLIPVTVVERALQRGSAFITYQREFTGQGGAATATVSLNVTTEAAAGFAIRRLNLYFNDQRPEITIPRLTKELKAFVEIDYTGTGPLEGFWEVDDRVIAFVSRPITFGETLVLESPSPPTLPTSDTGVHVVRFVVTSPATDLPMPIATYFVTPEEAVTRTYIELKSPEDRATIDYAPSKFTWKSSSPASAYQIIFRERGEKVSAFSAFVKDSSYQLGADVLKSRFSAGKTYSWMVQAIDANGNLTGESRTREITFEALRGYVPGQILVALEDKAYSEKLMAELAGKYRLKTLETFELRSILMKLTVFETSEKDIFRIITDMKKDDRIQMVQPNYVMMTHASGPKVTQYADTVIRLDRISPSFRGRGIRIALIDTGVDSSHADLKGRISAARNFVGPEGYRAEIHGTAVAGIISGGGIGVKGISPEAEVLALRACRQARDDAPEAECFTTSLSRAIDDAILSDAKVINMSFGAAQNDPLLARLITAGSEKEIIFVAPAGNASGERELRFPASHPDVVAVGGFDDRNRPYPNADIVKKASVSAPAVDVFTTVPGGRYNFLSGTSLSAGYVSGLIALAAERDHALTKKKLPRYQGNFCGWEEELLKISLCGK